MPLKPSDIFTVCHLNPACHTYVNLGMMLGHMNLSAPPLPSFKLSTYPVTPALILPTTEFHCAWKLSSSDIVLIYRITPHGLLI